MNFSYGKLENNFSKEIHNYPKEMSLILSDYREHIIDTSKEYCYSPPTDNINVTAFRIKGFKSIEDTGWIPINMNTLSAFIGLNESGKTSVLEALSLFSCYNDHKHDCEFKEFINKVPNKILQKKDHQCKISLKVTCDHEFNSYDGSIEEISSHVDRIFNRKPKADRLPGRYKKLKDKIIISRAIDFSESKFKKTHYEIDNFDEKFGCPVGDISKIKELISFSIFMQLPDIVYYKDFNYKFPEEIKVSKGNKFYNIVENLFFDNKITGGIREFMRRADNDVTLNNQTVLRLINERLNNNLFNKWGAFLCDCGVEAIELQHCYSKKEHVFKFLVIENNGSFYNISERSPGFQWVFKFIMDTEYSDKCEIHSPYGVICLMDEPGLNLHGEAQKRLLHLLQKIAEEGCLFYTTHSPNLISLYSNNNNYVVKKHNNSTQIINIKEEINNTKSGISHFQTLIDNLKIAPLNFGMGYPYQLAVEGVSDMNTISVMIKIINNENDFKFAINPCKGADSMSVLVSVYRRFDTKFLILLDSDDKGLAR